MEKPVINFDLNAFTTRVHKVGAEVATIEAVTNLLQMTYKAMTHPRKLPPQEKKDER